MDVDQFVSQPAWLAAALGATYALARLLSPVAVWLKGRIEKRDAFVEGLITGYNTQAAARDAAFTTALKEHDAALKELTAAVTALQGSVAAMKGSGHAA